MGTKEELAQGLIRRRVAKRPSDNAAGSSPALVSSMMEPIALTKPSPHVAGAGRTAVGSRIFKPNRARVGKGSHAAALTLLSSPGVEQNTCGSPVATTTMSPAFN
jgi:hypothetical protein